MGATDLFSLRASSCPETPGILAASHWQLLKLILSPDILVFLQPVGGANCSLFIGSQVLAGPERCTQSPFILADRYITSHPERQEIRKIENMVSLSS